jgi:glycosyltransferase involved in cell wall biosynthesis
VFSPDDGGTRKPDQILFVGFLRRVKGVDLLLHAMQYVVERNPWLRLVVVGGGFYESYRRQEEELHALASRLNLDGKVEFKGMKTPIEVARFMRESSLLVLPSRSETFGAVLIEALACGTPVLATRCGGPEEIVTDEVGRLVPKEDVEALARGILEMTDTRDRYDPRVLRRYAVDNFSWEKVADRTVDLYHRALQGSTA